MKLELPNGVFDFDMGMNVIEAIDRLFKEGSDIGKFPDWLSSFCEEITNLDDESLNELSRYLGELSKKKEHASNSVILDMIELMQLMIELNQKQRELYNLRRQGEGENARGELKQKANLTRAGAGQNFAMSMIGSGVSLLFAGISIGSSIWNLKDMSRTLNEGFGLEQTELSASSKLTDGASAKNHARIMEETLAKTEDPSFKLGDPEAQPQGRPSIFETVAQKLGIGGKAEAEVPAGEPEPENVVDNGRMPEDSKGTEQVRKVDREAFKKTRELLFNEDGNFQICDAEGKALPFEELPLKSGVTEADLANVKTVRQAIEVLDFESKDVAVEPGESPQGGTDQIAEQVKVELKTKISTALSADYQTARGNYALLADNIDSLKGAIKAGTYEDLGYASKDAAETELANMQAKAAHLKTVQADAAVAWTTKRPTGYVPRLGLRDVFLPRRRQPNLSMHFYGPGIVWFEGMKG